MKKSHLLGILVALSGALLALTLHRLWSLELRWFVVVTSGLTLLSVAMIFAPGFSDFLTVLLFLSIPLAGLGKLYFPSSVSREDYGQVLYAGTVGISLIDFLLAGLYMAWFFRLFVTRQEPFPRLEKIDGIVLLLIAAHVLSLAGAPDLPLGVSSTLFVVKNVAVYFYFSRKLRPEHLRWFASAIAFAVVLQSAIATLQCYGAVVPGLARDKGAGSSVLDAQYEVAGIETFTRGEGTTYDSHELGHLLVLMLPLCLATMLSRATPRPFRVASGTAFAFGLLALATTFSRSGWISFAVSLGIFFGIYLLYWKDRSVLPSLLVTTAIALLIAPWTLHFVFERFSTAPMELLTVRFEQYRLALSVWMDSPVFGFGAGNYLYAFDAYNDSMAPRLVVHNMPLWMAAETGLLGVVAFHSILIAALRRLGRVIAARSGLEAHVALAMLVGLIASFLDGLTDPSLRGPSVYLMFWLCVAWSVAFTRPDYETVSAVEQEHSPRSQGVRREI